MHRGTFEGATSPGVCRRLSKLVAPTDRRGKRRGQRTRPADGVEEEGFSGCLNPTAWVRAFRCNNVFIMRFRSMKVPMAIQTRYNKAEVRSLVDSGATDNFIHPRFVRRMKLGTVKLEKPK